MYVVFEYLTYLVLLVALGGLLFITSAAVLVTERSAKFVVDSTRKLAAHAGHMAAKHFKGHSLPLSSQVHDRRL